jgi:hypothetical protein
MLIFIKMFVSHRMTAHPHALPGSANRKKLKSIFGIKYQVSGIGLKVERGKEQVAELAENEIIKNLTKSASAPIST